MQNHAGRDGNGRILPVAFLRAVLAGADDHVGDVLRVGHIATGEQADFGKRIEARRTAFLDRREFETQVARLAAEAGGLGPVLALDVVDHRALLPREQCRDDQADAFAAARGREGENVLGAVVAEVVEACGFVGHQPPT